MNARPIALASLTILGLAAAPVALASHVAAPAVVEVQNQQLSGEITRIDLERNSFAVKVGEEQEELIRIDEKTKYVLDNKESTRDQVLKVGRTVAVTHNQKLASQVSAKTEK